MAVGGVSRIPLTKDRNLEMISHVRGPFSFCIQWGKIEERKGVE
jgi:hypothetical protein